MTRPVADVLADRAAAAGLTLPPTLAARLIAYYDLLSHWNRKINLTSLSDPSEAVDRLLLEPIAAAPSLPPGLELIDLGSGGGSPALPLALVLNVPRLVMVESRGRKAAFLREALRELQLAGEVEAARFEEVSRRPAYAGRFELLSVRAVRLDAGTLTSVAQLLRPGGVAALLGNRDAEPQELPLDLQLVSTGPLLPSSRSALTLLRRQ